MTEPLEIVALCKGTAALLVHSPVSPLAKQCRPAEVAWIWSGRSSAGRWWEEAEGSHGEADGMGELLELGARSQLEREEVMGRGLFSADT